MNEKLKTAVEIVAAVERFAAGPLAGIVKGLLVHYGGLSAADAAQLDANYANLSTALAESRAQAGQS